MGMLFFVYGVVATVGVVHSLVVFMNARRPRHVLGAMVLALTVALLVLPESWIVDTIVSLGIASTTAGAYLASALHRPSSLAPFTFGVLVVIGLLLGASGRRGKRASNKS